MLGHARYCVDYEKLANRLEAHNAIVSAFNRYYQFYANSFVSVAAFYCLVVLSESHFVPFGLTWRSLGVFVALEILLFFSSNYSFRQYHKGREQLVGRDTRDVK